MTWGWPQWVLAFLIALELGLAFALHGRPRPAFSLPMTGLDLLILVWLTLAGGFWS